ncbi:hypothetical protein D3C76_552030 [compost metagenome]
MRLDRLQYFLEALGVARNDVAFFEEIVSTVKVADQTACFLDQQGAGSHVPFRQAGFPERIETAGGDIGQVQAGGASAADAGSLADQAAEHAQVVVQVVHLVVAEWEASAQQCAFQALAWADAQAAAVQLGAATTGGGEFFLAHWVQNHGVLEAATVFAGNADGKVRDATQEVGGAIEGVDDPQVVFAFTAACVQAGFFTEDTMGRIGLAQGIDDALLGRAIDFRDVILGVFFVDLDGIQALDGAEDQFTGAAGGAQRDIQHGLHGRFTWVVKESRTFYQKTGRHEGRHLHS